MEQISLVLIPQLPTLEDKAVKAPHGGLWKWQGTAREGAAGAEWTGQFWELSVGARIKTGQKTGQCP
jgi:hypothetical protein